MRLLMVVANFVPEIGAAAHIYFDLAKAFGNLGYDLDVITSYPRSYNIDSENATKNVQLEELIDNIKIHRCKHISKRDNIVIRGLEHFLLPIYYFNTYRKLGIKFDACLIYVPPLPLYYFARSLKKFSGTPSVLNFEDFHPQELTDVGVLKNNLFIKIMEYIEKASYKNADYITVMSNGGIDYIVKRGGKSSRIEHIFNGCIVSDFDKYLTKKDFKKKREIEDKFLISYAGILSPFQGIDNILNAAKILGEHKDIIFYLIGDGMIKDHLEMRLKNEGIGNIKLLSLQPREEYFNIINSSDISLVSLDERMMAPCIPGKLTNLMATGQPVIAIVPENSETAKIIRTAKCGIVVKPSRPDSLKEAILNLKENPENLKTLGQNGRIFLERNMDLNDIVLKYDKIFNKIKKF